MGGKTVEPLYGKDDAPAAMKCHLQINPPPCLCLRLGKNLQGDKLKRVVSRIKEFLPVESNEKEIAEALTDKGYIRYILQ